MLGPSELVSQSTCVYQLENSSVVLARSRHDIIMHVRIVNKWLLGCLAFRVSRQFLRKLSTSRSRSRGPEETKKKNTLSRAHLLLWSSGQRKSRGGGRSERNRSTHTTGASAKRARSSRPTQWCTECRWVGRKMYVCKLCYCACSLINSIQGGMGLKLRRRLSFEGVSNGR